PLAACDLHSFPTRRSSDLVQSLAVTNDSVLLAGVQALGILRSTDHGSTWVLCDTADNVHALATSPNGHVFAGLSRGSYQGIHRSDRKSTRLNSSHDQISYA